MEEKADWVELLDLSNRGPHEFFRSLDEINSAYPIPLHVHAMRRAWREMELDGILCIERVPVVYFKEIRQPSQTQLCKLQRQLWNQSIAPILVVITLTEILVYSGLALPAKDDENVDDNNRLVETFNKLADALKIRQFVRGVELGEFFRTNPESFNPEHKVDYYLLENLDAARDMLEKQIPGQIDTATVHALLGRTIFTCYLIDRGIINGAYFKKVDANGSKALLDVFNGFPSDQAKTILFKLFRELRSDFNGDVFEGDLDREELLLQPAHIELLGRFLKGDNVVNAQRSLGFWAYDFEFIPIETISGIYESFLVAESPEKKRESGAYYTPRFLAELVLDIALEGNSSLLEKRCLDPACGSGIFLVGLFNQMAEEWRRRNPRASYDAHANALIDILLQNLFGVDQSLIACRIAAFSLYIALLDQLSPSDIQRLQNKGKFLPHLVALHDGDKNQNSGTNLFQGDFFDESLFIPSDGFNLIIGNPPWTRPKKGPKTKSERWCESKGLPIPQRQVAAGFVWKAPRHLRDEGVVCFLLPAPLLFSYGKGIDFQSKWLSEHAVEKVVNLADMRFYLFPGSIHPALIVKYKKSQPDKLEHYIEYLTPKTEPETLRADILVISPEDRKDLRLLAILDVLDRREPAFVWKEAFWGTPRDRRFIDRLNEYTKLSDWGDKHDKAWKVDEGFNKGGDGEPKDRAILHEIPFLPAKAFSAYVILESELLKRPPTYEPRRMANEAIFRSPHAVFPHGVSRKGERIKAAFSSFDFSFTQTIRGIHVDQENEDELRFLTCALASPLALYFFFHTSFNWAIDRPHLLVAEYEAFPFPMPETKNEGEIIRLVAKLHRSIESKVSKNPNDYKTIIKEHETELDKLVLRYFNVDSWEEALIEDTVKVWIPSATPRRDEKSIPALEPSSPTHRSNYMNLLLEALNTWAKRSDKRIEGRSIISREANLGVVSLRKVDRLSSQTQVSESESSESLVTALRRLSHLLPEETKSMRLLRNLKIFDGNRLDILKPLARRYWTKTAALNDADEIAAAVLTSSSNVKRYGANQG
ncbi:MAG TPA: N-6 DNA methylase [Pyrinomonadaceae bacterium]|nr:N-6 DNA methylase [Pyrinomonadaceae bacterium]